MNVSPEPDLNSRSGDYLSGLDTGTGLWYTRGLGTSALSGHFGHNSKEFQK
jgi:uncharacterized membrane protein YhiD involved in acid resistance